MPRTFEEDQLATVSQLLDQLDHTASAARRLDLSVQIRNQMRNFLQSTRSNHVSTSAETLRTDQVPFPSEPARRATREAERRPGQDRRGRRARLPLEP
jgi:hypothetical protein